MRSCGIKANLGRHMESNSDVMRGDAASGLSETRPLIFPARITSRLPSSTRKNAKRLEKHTIDLRIQPQLSRMYLLLRLSQTCNLADGALGSGILEGHPPADVRRGSSHIGPCLECKDVKGPSRTMLVAIGRQKLYILEPIMGVDWRSVHSTLRMRRVFQRTQQRLCLIALIA